MKEAPVAAREAAVDRSVLLLKVLMAGISPPRVGLLFDPFSRSVGESKPGGDIKFSEQWLGSTGESVCRHSLEDARIGKGWVPSPAVDDQSQRSPALG